jgi:uncharacterized protein YndB with AHSA1/START domain
MPAEKTQASLSQQTSASTQVFEIYIKASAERVWEAITSPEWTAKYGYQGPTHYELRAGGKFEARANDDMRKYGLPEVIVDGEVLEAVPPRRLVQTYRFLFNEEHKAEGFTKLTFEIEATPAGFSRLTVTHEVEGAPMMAKAIKSKFDLQGGGGWNWILSDLKSLLETGKIMSAS